MTHIQKNGDNIDENNFIPEHMGTIKAIKFQGIYYKFDPDFNMADQLLNPVKLSTTEESS